MWSTTRGTRAARIFGSGLNLTRLYLGQLPFMFFITRDLGYVNKIYRGLSGPEYRPDEPEETTEKLWVAAAETYAIGGACQLLHVMDHVIAARGCRLFLPARKEGIIPGASTAAAAPIGRRPAGAAGDPLRAGVRGGRPARGAALRRGGRSPTPSTRRSRRGWRR